MREQEDLGNTINFEATDFECDVDGTTVCVEKQFEEKDHKKFENHRFAIKV